MAQAKARHEEYSRPLFNVGFIMNPEGDVILKHYKVAPSILLSIRFALTIFMTGRAVRKFLIPSGPWSIQRSGEWGLRWRTKVPIQRMPGPCHEWCRVDIPGVYPAPSSFK